MTHVMQSIWYFRVFEYWKQMKSVVEKDSFRNVMDMNSNLGGFAAALKDKDVWVMNVAPVNASAKLKIIYDRGLIGTVHDWYAFDPTSAALDTFFPSSIAFDIFMHILCPESFLLMILILAQECNFFL